MNNRGSLYVFNTQVEFKGIVAFMNNFGDSGGAITAILSEISFNTATTVTIFNNTATNGGGMSLTQNTRIYKNRLQVSLETLFFTNIVIRTISEKQMRTNYHLPTRPWPFHSFSS